MSEESRESVLIQIGELRGTTKAHKDLINQQHEDIVKMRDAISAIQIGQEQLKGFMLTCFADQTKMLTERLDSISVRPSPASALREFMESRPATTAGLSSALGVVAYCLGVMAGILPPPK